MAFRVNINGEDLLWPSDQDENWANLTQNIIKAIASSTLQKSAGKFSLSDELNFGANHGIVTKELGFSKNKDVKLTIDEQEDLTLSNKKIAFKAQLNRDVNDLNNLISDINNKITSINSSLSELNASINQTSSLAENAKRVADDANKIAENAINSANIASKTASTANNSVNNLNQTFVNFTKDHAFKNFTGTFHRPGDHFSIISGSENIYGQIYIKVTGRQNWHEVRSYNFIACENLIRLELIAEHSNTGKGLFVPVEQKGNQLVVRQGGAAEPDYPHAIKCKVVAWKVDA